jgi:hypothetical protein
MKQPPTIAPRGSGVYMKSVVFIDESWQEPEESESGWDWEIDLPSRHIILMTSGWDWEIDLPSRHIIYSVLCVHFGDCISSSNNNNITFCRLEIKPKRDDKQKDKQKDT